MNYNLNGYKIKIFIYENKEYRPKSGKSFKKLMTSKNSKWVNSSFVDFWEFTICQKKTLWGRIKSKPIEKWESKL